MKSHIDTHNNTILAANNSVVLPWYKQFWPWFLITFPATAVVAGIATIFIAMHEPDGLVVGNYYKEGLAINEQLARDRNAQFLGLSASGQLEAGNGQIHLALDGKQPVAESTLILHLLHPTRAKQDTRVTLSYDPRSKRYTGPSSALTAGNWHLRLTPEQGQWQIRGRVRLPGDGKFLLQSVLAQ